MCRKNKKRGASQLLRPLEQTESKVVYNEFERPEPSSASDEQNWTTQENRVQVGKTDANTGTISPTAHGEADRMALQPLSAEKASSDCSSSSSSVRASRGSWGSWSSSSSDGDKKPPMVGALHFLPAGDGTSPTDFPPEAPLSLNLSPDVCDSEDVNSFPQCPETPCPGLPTGPVGVDEEKGLYHPGDVWSAQPVCVTNGFNCTLDNSLPGVLQAPAPVPTSSFIDWNSACEGQFPNMYCPLDLNDYNAFPEENMNYPNGFPCPTEVQTDFIDHSTQSTWNAASSMPAAWGHAGLISSSPYLTSTCSLSPMSGLFGSIWAPQSDVYENCCPLSPAAEHSPHMENQAVMCKEYYLGFNPFRTYMNLDIWTTPANRNPTFPLSRDSSYCGNV